MAVTELGQAVLAALDLSPPRSFEVRKSDAFHDRFVVPAAGDILQIGTSLSGIAKRFSVMVTLGSDAAALAVQAFEEAWEKGEVMAASKTIPVEAAEAIALAPEPEVVTEDAVERPATNGEAAS